MLSNRYTIVIADRRTGVVRRFTIGLRPLLSVVGTVLALPILIGLGAAWKAKAEVADLYAAQAALELENSSFRGATEALTGQITALQTAISDLGGRAALDPALQSAMDKLPAIVKNRAMGGASSTSTLAALTPGLSSPEDTFGLLRDLLQGIESRLRLVRSDVDRRNALAAATPSIWPAHGLAFVGHGRPERPVHRRGGLPPRPRHLGRSRHAGLRHRRRHGDAGVDGGRVRQPGRHRPPVRARDALRPPLGLPHRSAARR